MRVAIGADHGGFALKQTIARWLEEGGFQLIDVGAAALDPDDDYPDFAIAVARALQAVEAERGIVICGSGVGAAIAANKLRGVRAAVCHDTYSARQGVEHDDMNVLCVGARIVGVELAREIVTGFLNASFSGQERHIRRLNKVLALEQELQRT